MSKFLARPSVCISTLLWGRSLMPSLYQSTWVKGSWESSQWRKRGLPSWINLFLSFSWRSENFTGGAMGFGHHKKRIRRNFINEVMTWLAAIWELQNGTLKSINTASRRWRNLRSSVRLTTQATYTATDINKHKQKREKPRSKCVTLMSKVKQPL